MSGHSAFESSTQYYNDVALALAFSCTTLIAGKRMHWSYSQGGPTETTVVTAFYSLILTTALARAVWFAIPSEFLEPEYTPGTNQQPVTAFEGPWMGTFVSELMLSAGSLSLFSIFILILVYWADILKKYFYPGLRRNKPMSIFLSMVGALVVISATNVAFFLARVYTSDGMILCDSIVLGTVSLICVAEISIFSHRFRTVLRTLGAINQVSTESQVKRIVWITVTGNIFFLCRAALEITMTYLLVSHYLLHKNFKNSFTDDQWNTYILVKHWSEVAILCLMLYILQSRFNAANRKNDSKHKYSKVPDVEPKVAAQAREGKKGKGGAKINPTGGELNV